MSNGSDDRKPPTQDKQPQAEAVAGEQPDLDVGSNGEAPQPWQEREAAAEDVTPEPVAGADSPERHQAEAHEAAETAGDWSESADSDYEPEETSEPERRRPMGCLWLIAIIVIVGVAGYVTRSQWWPMVAEYVPAEIVEKLGGTAEPVTATAPTETPPQTAMHPSEPSGSRAEPGTEAPAAMTPAAPTPPAGETTTAGEAPASEPASPGEPAPAPGDTAGTASESSAMASGDGEAEIATLQADMQRVLTEMSLLSAKLRSMEASVSKVAALQSALSQVATLQERVGALEGMASHVNLLENRLAQVEATRATVINTQLKASARVLALHQLRQTVDQGRGYAAELKAMQSLTGDDSAFQEQLDRIAPYASQGVPTMLQLRTQFYQVARELSRIHPGTTGDTWHDRLLNRLTNLIRVRRTGEAAIAAGGTDGVLAETQQALINGDLSTAVDAMAHLEGAEATAAQDWLSQARRRLSVEEALSALSTESIEKLAAAGR